MRSCVAYALALSLMASLALGMPGCRLGQSSRIVYVAAGTSSSFVLTESGELYAWGWNDEGALGIGSTEDTRTPTRVALKQRVKQVVPGAFAVALTEDGEVFMWGVTEFRFMQFEPNLYTTVPVKVDLPEKIVRLGIGRALGLAISESGSLYTWGWNYYGQRGDGTRDNSFTPHRVDLPGRVTDASGMDSHVLALMEDGSVYAWGSNFFGEIGDGLPVSYVSGEELTETVVLVPQKVPFERRIVAVATGRGVSYALDENGTLYSFGANDVGQLGIGRSEVVTSSTPVQVAVPGRVKMIASGDFHALALTEDGTLYGWGRNSSDGEISVLGIGSTEKTVFEPRIIPVPGEIIFIAAGGGHNWVITDDHKLYGWGANGYGQLHTDLPRRVNTPTEVVVDLKGGG